MIKFIMFFINELRNDRIRFKFMLYNYTMNFNVEIIKYYIVTGQLTIRTEFFFSISFHLEHSSLLLFKSTKLK